MLQKTISVQNSSRGLQEITAVIRENIGQLPKTGLLNLFIQHTSASLIIQENADPTAKQDLEEFLNRLAPDGQNWHAHTLEGEDDTTAHMKTALTQTSLNIPIQNGELALGTWQGVYLWEHRKATPARNIILTVIS